MTANQYIELSCIAKIPLKDLARELYSSPNNKYYILLEQNRESIINDFFETFFLKLDQKKYSLLKEHFILLLIDPFTIKDGPRFLQMLYFVNNEADSGITDDLLDNLWTILDNVFHNSLHEDVQNEFETELKKLRLKILRLPHCSLDSVALLEQKIGHFLGYD
ncbi:hypothetical protein Q765_09140 [Flavobacterium rivuli WB 3.3-2 = DSM 21788]|uniref:Uncharacterized protein n=1 Tax=Flavobacterium rivuli WB 3.3-2 = DSM 21788 TaxID=1121895 RepID=A0A0A2M5A7_9FLAO|nr:hypothetical protein [Flavobacterium rivuli]KGO86781.1 hypothetical protein Q765_09140 [Flavobacterium rivuli WB 3.3-2 = DSM 21788]